MNKGLIRCISLKERSNDQYIRAQCKLENNPSNDKVIIKTKCFFSIIHSLSLLFQNKYVNQVH